MKETLISVGIDLGTSTTQIIFSKLSVENLASAYAVPDIKITGREIIYESKIYFTPLLSKTEIDGEGIKKIVSDEYRKAGIKPEDVKTGAVIITGETARKENAAVILETLSNFAGEFVVSTAGPDLESVLSGFGSGAASISENEKSVIVNVDIGGGTSNISVFKNGNIQDVCCLDVGGRLIKVDSASGKITYIYSKFKDLLDKAGVYLPEDSYAIVSSLKFVTDKMADILACALGLADVEMSDAAFNTTLADRGFYTNDGKGLNCRKSLKIDGITFSGGVGTILYEILSGKQFSDNIFEYGDIGVLLALSIFESPYFSKLNIRIPKETIRATVIGAGMYTTEISGSTILYSMEALPLKNVPVLFVNEEETSKINEVLQKNLSFYANQQTFNPVAISLDGFLSVDYDSIQLLAKKIMDGAGVLIQNRLPLIIVLQNDIAKALGFALRSILPENYPLVCIDSIRAKNGDYIDIGMPVAGNQVLPVVIKTLVFNS
ncbi:MAG: ethanolamine ammonia-lyase reactivating factor EutA [Treponema sp.]|nr:ethanolamine ammonia-lyase reactivating factor EutA [Candidatus Treponema equifaecale]